MRISDWSSDVCSSDLRVAKVGIGLVPEGRQIFPNLSVRENLVATAANRRAADSPWTYERVTELFPRLAERAGNMGNQLSGGDKQMREGGRALMTNPHRLILEDGPAARSSLHCGTRESDRVELGGSR